MPLVSHSSVFGRCIVCLYSGYATGQKARYVTAANHVMGPALVSLEYKTITHERRLYWQNASVGSSRAVFVISQTFVPQICSILIGEQ